MGCCRSSPEVKQPGSECMEQPELCDGCGFVESVLSVLQAKDLHVVHMCMLPALCPAFQLENVSRVSEAWSCSHFPPRELQINLNHLWDGAQAAACLQNEKSEISLFLMCHLF